MCLAVPARIASNNVAIAGARPLYLAAGFILEDGFGGNVSRVGWRESSCRGFAEA